MPKITRSTIPDEDFDLPISDFLVPSSSIASRVFRGVLVYKGRNQCYVGGEFAVGRADGGRRRSGGTSAMEG